MKTKADLLIFAIAYALSSVRVGRNRLGLSEEARYQVAEDTIKELRRHGGWKELDDDIPDPLPGVTGPSKGPPSG